MKKITLEKKKKKNKKKEKTGSGWFSREREKFSFSKTQITTCMNYLLEASLSFGFVPQLGGWLAHSIIVYRVALCTIFTILLTLWNSEQKNGLLIKLFCFSSDFDETWWSCSYPCVLQFHQALSKSNEKQKSFINSRFNGCVVR